MTDLSDDNPESNEKSHCECDPEHDSDIDLWMEDDVDTPYGIDLNGNVDIK